MIEHELKSGHVVFVDDEDAYLLNHLPWRAMPVDSLFYVTATMQFLIPTREHYTVLLHRLILDAPDGMDVDHKNHNGLDNRRANLRVCTRQQNLANCRPGRNNTSGYKGVSWSKQHRKWASYITVDYKKRHLGLFMEKRDAATAYNSAAFEAWGEFAYLNDVNQNSNRIKEQG
jgi:hypothetical protein